MAALAAVETAPITARAARAATSRRPGSADPRKFDEDRPQGSGTACGVLMGGRGGRSGGPGGGRSAKFPVSPRTLWLAGIVAVLGFWAFNSSLHRSARKSSRGIVPGRVLLGGQSGPQLRPLAVMTAEVVNVTSERTEDVGDIVSNRVGGLHRPDADDRRQYRRHRFPGGPVNINDPAKFLFNLRDGRDTVRARGRGPRWHEIIARTELAPILKRDRGLIADGVREVSSRRSTATKAASPSSASTSTGPIRPPSDRRFPRGARPPNRSVTASSGRPTPTPTAFSQAPAVKPPRSLEEARGLPRAGRQRGRG